MEKENGYGLGIIGGIIGGFIASIPWILMYVYGNMILSLLAIIIAYGVLKGYQTFKGKVDEHLPTIIVVISVLVVTVSTLVLIPMCLMAKEGFDISIRTFDLAYSSKAFASAIMKDYVISLIFTFLGISGVVSNVKKQVLSGNTNNVKVSLDSIQNNDELKQSLENIKSIFVKYDALNKYNTIDKETVLQELNDPNAKFYFNNLCTKQIIIKYKGKYYFSEENEKSPMKRFLKLFLKILGIVIIITAVMLLVVAVVTPDEPDNNSNLKPTATPTSNEKVTYKTVTHDKISYEIPSNWEEMVNYREDRYRRYTPKIGSDGYYGSFSVGTDSYEYTTNEFSDFESIIKDFTEEEYADYETKIESITEKKYPMIKITIEFAETEESDDYTITDYYIAGNYQYSVISLMDYHDNKVDFDSVINDVVDSLEFKSE